MRNFFRSSGFVAVVQLEDRKTVTADWYTTVCLPKVITAIDLQGEKTGVRRILLHYDNASSHTALRTREFLEDSGLKHCPILPTVKDQLRGRRSSTNKELAGAKRNLIVPDDRPVSDV